MILLADEGVDRQIVVKLRAEGHVVTYIAEMEPGISDEMVLFRAREAGAVLITEDKDFGDLVFRQGLVTNGVVLLRLAGFPSEEKATRVARSLKEHGHEIGKAFTVISGSSIRIRRFREGN